MEFVGGTGATHIGVLAALAWAGLIGGCDDKFELGLDGGIAWHLEPPPTENAQVTVNPSDLTVGTSARGGVSLRFRELSAETSEAIAHERVRLVEWPERTPIESNVWIAGRLGTPGASVELVPTYPLEDRWYAVEIDDLAGLATLSRRRLVTTPEGGAAARFHPTYSLAVLRSIEVARAGRAFRFRVNLSGGLTDLRPANELLEFGPDVTCEPTPEGGPGRDLFEVLCVGFSGPVTALRLVEGVSTSAGVVQDVWGEPPPTLVLPLPGGDESLVYRPQYQRE